MLKTAYWLQLVVALHNSARLSIKMLLVQSTFNIHSQSLVPTSPSDHTLNSNLTHISLSKTGHAFFIYLSLIYLLSILVILYEILLEMDYTKGAFQHQPSHP